MYTYIYINTYIPTLCRIIHVFVCTSSTEYRAHLRVVTQGVCVCICDHGMPSSLSFCKSSTEYRAHLRKEREEGIPWSHIHTQTPCVPTQLATRKLAEDIGSSARTVLCSSHTQPNGPTKRSLSVALLCARTRWKLTLAGNC